MKCLSTVMGALLVYRGVVLLGWPRMLLRFWSGENVPPCIRNYVQMWEPLSDDALRMLGINQLLLGGLILALAGRVRE